MGVFNPFESPNASPEGPTPESESQLQRTPYVLTALLLSIGGCFLLLLNGQVFTNTLVFLACAAVSALLCLPTLLTPRSPDRRRLAFYVVIGHVAVILAIAVGLPGLHQKQQRFNDTRNELQ